MFSLKTPQKLRTKGIIDVDNMEDYMQELYGSHYPENKISVKFRYHYEVD